MNTTDTVTKLDRSTWTALILLGFSGQLAWAIENQFYNTYMYDKITPDPQAVSWMVAITAVVALITTILMGTWSDRSRSRWGRRRPFMLIGYILWGIFTAMFPFAAFFQPVALGVFMAILFDSIMSFFGSTSSDAAFNAYVTDVTTPQNRGRVVGILEILKWVALLIVYAGAGFIVQAWGYFALFYGIGGLVLIMGIIGGVMLKDPPATEPVSKSYWKQITDTLQWNSLRQNRNLLLILIAMMLFNMAFNVFFPYLLIYLQHYIKLDNGQSSLLIGLSILIGGIGMAYPVGLLVDRWGRRPIALVAAIVECVGLVLFSFCNTLPTLLVTGILWILPMVMWNIATDTWSRDLFPEENRGQFNGYVILFRVTLTMIPGPIIGGWLSTLFGIPTVLDGKPGFIPTPLLFQVAGLATLLALIPLLMIKSQSPSKETLPISTDHK